MSKPGTIKSLRELVGPDTLICDGDWIESKDQDPHGEVRLIQLADIGDGVFLNKSERYLRKDQAARLNCTFLHPGDILLARMPDPIARCCIFPDIGQPAVTAVDVCIIRLAPGIDSYWIMNLINSPGFRKAAESRAGGATRSRITRSELEKIQSWTPDSKNEVAEISNLFWRVDAVMTTANTMLNALQLRKRGLMQQLLNGKRRFPGFTKPWIRVRMHEILHEERRLAPWDDKAEYSLISVRRRCEGLFLRNRCPGSDIETKKLFAVKTGDFLVSIKQVAHGAMGIVTPEFDGMHVSDSYVIFAAKRKDALDISFFSWLTKTPWVQHLATKASHGVHIEKMFFDPDYFLKQTLEIPESVDEQKRISAFLISLDDEISRTERLLAAYREQKKGLMQQLLTGKRRVKVRAA